MTVKEGATRLLVSETFVSIQGESSFAGLPCFFVRLSGCNLRCSYCDTRYAYSGGYEMEIDEVLAAVRASGIGLVEVTGGEPLLQSATFPLVRRLCEEGCRVLVETNGSVDLGGVDSRAVIILDLKTPGSGMSERMLYENIERLKPSDEIKFVITGRADYEWMKGVVQRYDLARRNLLLSPAFGLLPAEELACWIIEDRLNARLNIQLHKHVFRGSVLR